MSFQTLCINGVRLQDNADFEDWAVKMFNNSCRMCNTYNLGIDCDCDRCPIWLAHQRALERIRNQNNNQANIVSSCVTKFSGDVEAETAKQKVPSGDVRELPMIPTRLYNSLLKNNLICISDIRKVIDDSLEIGGVGTRGMEKLKECLDAFDKERGHIKEEKEAVVQQVKRKYNRTITVMFESEKFSKEEWMILNLLIKKGGKVKKKVESE